MQIPDSISTETGSYNGDGGYTTGTFPVITSVLTPDDVAQLTDETGRFHVKFRVPVGCNEEPRELLSYLLDVRSRAFFGKDLHVGILGGSYSYHVNIGKIAYAEGNLVNALNQAGYHGQAYWG